MLISRLTQSTTDEGSSLTEGRMQIDIAQNGVLVIQTYIDKARKVLRKEATNAKAIDGHYENFFGFLHEGISGMGL